MSQQEFEEEMDLLFSNPKIINKKTKISKKKILDLKKQFLNPMNLIIFLKILIGT